MRVQAPSVLYRTRHSLDDMTRRISLSRMGSEVGATRSFLASAVAT
jgi:hypothetical protein